MSDGEALVVAMWQGIFDWALRKQQSELDEKNGNAAPTQSNGASDQGE